MINQNTTRTISVPAHKRDPNVFGVQKYSNNAPWNVPGGCAPNGVSATRYLRHTSPDDTQLSPLARFLFENCPPCVAGKMPAHKYTDRVRILNGKTQADMERLNYKKYLCPSYNCTTDADAKIMAERYIHAYALENELCQINDWLFAIIEPNQTDEEYWNQEAKRMLAADAVRIETNNKIFEV
ncbi:MAG: hypothetical protein H8E14_01155 [Candidatus Marinimicrobia bacterium]|nr:hypothetical protein [Candidatus Neomarinimicrobiota bacterium]